MNRSDFPLTRDLVLIGGGHAHALVLRSWAKAPLVGARLTLITDTPGAPYSGMLPGYIAGHYPHAALEIDLFRLARVAGARLVLARATGIDRENQRVLVKNRPPVGYDLLSINVGISSDLPALRGFAEHALPVKPLAGFLAGWHDFLAGGGGDIAVIGGGVAGAELCLAMSHCLRTRALPGQVHLIDRLAILSEPGARARGKLLAELTAAGIALHPNTEVSALERNRVLRADGPPIAAKMIIAAAGARAPGWLQGLGVKTTDGFLHVSDTLQTTDPSIFAAGDCAHFDLAPRPKAGVFAVRAAPILAHNLKAGLAGTDMRRFHPQRDYLKLVSLGGKSAMAVKWGLAIAGPLLWRWKDHIDRRFMAQFSALSPMPRPSPPAMVAKGVAEALGNRSFCTGCGAKVGPATLATVIADAGGTGEDAALDRIGGADIALTTDHLSAVTSDPWTMGRIAAVHALGDIWAMGAQPRSALVSLILPRMSQPLQARTLDEIMTGAKQVFAQAGAEIKGGHSSLGAEMTMGFSILGTLSRPAIRHAGAQAGDALILSKPLGTGTILAAAMAGRISGADEAACLASMVMGQSEAARILSGAHAMTDVTGFGLAGHLLNICRASGVAARLDLDAIPLLSGALEAAEAGIRSTLFDENAAAVPGLVRSPRADLLLDPQTAGGLLAAVPATGAAQLVEALRRAGFAAALVGDVTSGAPALQLN